MVTIRKKKSAGLGSEVIQHSYLRGKKIPIDIVMQRVTDTPTQCNIMEHYWLFRAYTSRLDSSIRKDAIKNSLVLGDIMEGINDYFKELSTEDIDAGVHRDFIGGHWDLLGKLQLDFMRDQGLKPDQKVLDIGCGALRAGDTTY